ncbi:MAG TPA: YcaO-like family protein [Leptolyngbyaceae cyanobacterium]
MDLPSSIRTAAFQKLSDIPVSPEDVANLTWGAFFKLPILYHDIRGQLHVRDHVFAGMGIEPEGARFRCFMEAIERTAALSEWAMMTLPKLGQPDIPWSAFFPYTDEQICWLNHMQQGRPDYQIAATQISDGKIINVPAVAVLPWWKSFSNNCLPIPEGDGVGFAAGFSYDRASTIHRAICEVLERDALMLSWKVPRWPKRTLDKNFVADNLIKVIKQADLSLRLIDIGEAKGLRVAIAVLTDSRKQTTIGVACGDSIENDVNKAILEALMLRGSAQQLINYRPNLTKQIITSEDHVMWGWFNGETVWEWYCPDEAQTFVRENTDPLVACTQLGLGQPLIIDVTPPDFAVLDFVVYRALIPHAFKKEYSHAYQYRGGLRLERLGVKASELNSLPHPIG